MPSFAAAQSIARRARELGFDAVGFARADEPLAADHDRYLAFVAAGRHGEMRSLARHAEVRRRLDTDAILAGARTVVCVARGYGRGRAACADPPLVQRIARYARGRDYHGFMREALGELASYVRTLGRAVAARALIDTAPVLERAWAVRAGLGFVGKQGMLIVPELGSYCLLGEVVTTLAVDEAALGTPLAERCGGCRACLDACPGAALIAPFLLDPRRCVSYWTIEARAVAPPALRAAVGRELFGCDACQQSCPHNQILPLPESRTAPFAPLGRYAELGLTALVQLGEPAWRELTRDSPLRRATRSGLVRNALLLAATRLGADPGDVDAAAALRLARRHPDVRLRALGTELAAAGEPAGRRAGASSYR